MKIYFALKKNSIWIFLSFDLTLQRIYFYLYMNISKSNLIYSISNLHADTDYFKIESIIHVLKLL